MSEADFADAFEPIAVSTRTGREESLHVGVATAIDPDGRPIATLGRPDVGIYPRSCLKPLQAHAMVGCGLELEPDLLALACSSHSGEDGHLDGVRRILDQHGLVVDDLDNTPAMPYGADARRRALAAGRDPSSLQQNCSGKHAAMLATCRVNGWETDGYLDPEHPLQRSITDTIVALSSEAGGAGGAGDAAQSTETTDVHVGVDGCGAPTHLLSVRRLALAFARLPGTQVARAMVEHAWLVGGTGRDVTAWIAAGDGLIAKEGAAGVMAIARPDGSAAAFKIADGSDQARRAVTIEAMRILGVEASADTLAAAAVSVLGHGRPVGSIEPRPWRVSDRG